MFSKSTALILRSLHYLLGRLIFGRCNAIDIHSSVVFWLTKIRLKGKDNKLVIACQVSLKHTKIIIHGHHNSLIIGEGVRIYEGCEILIEGHHSCIEIGQKTTIGSANIFCGESNTSIQIGEDCMLSRKVYLNTSDFHSILDRLSGKRVNPPQNICIANHVWVGFNTTINKGAVLGSNSIVASRAVVGGKTFPGHVILAGLPAKVIKENIDWSREKLPF